MFLNKSKKLLHSDLFVLYVCGSSVCGFIAHWGIPIRFSIYGKKFEFGGIWNLLLCPITPIILPYLSMKSLIYDVRINDKNLFEHFSDTSDILDIKMD